MKDICESGHQSGGMCDRVRDRKLARSFCAVAIDFDRVFTSDYSPATTQSRRIGSTNEWVVDKLAIIQVRQGRTAEWTDRDECWWWAERQTRRRY